MATTTKTPPKKVGKYSTSVGLKIQMAVTGLFFVFFVLMHMYGNLKMFFGPEAYNGYAHWLRDFGYPVLQHGWFLWFMRIGLIVAIVLHVRAAAILVARNKKARGSDKYDVTSGKKKQQSYASRTMKWGGIIIVAFIIFHLLQYTILSISIGADDYKAMEPYDRMIAGFSSDVWWAYLLYFIPVGFLAMHIAHGAWSALATLGLSNRRREATFKTIAVAIGLVIFIGFMAPPTAILFGIIP